MSYEFLYPKSRQFSFDEVCENIVRELEKRNWNVKNIAVYFDNYGVGKEKYRHVTYINGKNFCIHFGRDQGKLSEKWNDYAAVSEIIIPRKDLLVFDDESGPKLCIYVGKNWKNDQNDFFNNVKVLSKYYKKPRTYLVYSGVTYNSRSSILINDNDIGREYDLLPGDKFSFKTEKIFTEFKLWLEKNVLNYILSQPIGEKIEEFNEDLPVPQDFEILYTKVEPKDVKRIRSLKNYCLIPSYRLIPLSLFFRNSIPKSACDGSIWCSNNQVNEYLFPCYTSSDLVSVQIKLKNINEVYVAELFGQEEYRKDLFDIPGKECMTDDEYKEYLIIPGRTIVPLSNYQKNYIKPVFLINRELDFDEVETIPEDCHLG